MRDIRPYRRAQTTHPAPGAADTAGAARAAWWALACALGTVPVVPARAQRSTAPPAPAGRLEGTAFDSLARAPLAGALVWVPAREPGSPDGGPRSALTDSAGRWSLDDLSPGRVAVVLAHPALDSAGLAELRTDAEVVAGATRRLALASPSYATLAARLCPGGVPPDSGIVVGTVGDGRGTLLAGARVEAAWDKLTDPRAPDFGASQARRAETDGRGVYALCGVPVDQMVTAVAVAGGARTGLLDVLVPSSRLLRLDLVVGAAAPSRASAGRPTPTDSAATPAAAPLPRGDAVLEGVARDSAGQAVAGAVVAVREAGREARGGADGRFRLGDLPGGTHMVDVLALGYAPERLRVDLAPGRSTMLDVLLRRAVTLSTVNVRAAATTRFYTDLDRRRALGQGVVRRAEQIANYPSVATVFRDIPRTLVSQGRGTSSVYLRNGVTPCAPLIYLDGYQVEWGGGNSGSIATILGLSGDVPLPARVPITPMGNLDQLPLPHEIAAIEVYRSTSSVPAELKPGMTECGAVYVWTKQHAAQYREKPARR